MKKAKIYLKKHKRLVPIIGGLVLLAIIPAVFLTRNTSSSISTTQTSLVERGAITETVEALGVVAAMPSASITWKSNGIVSSYKVKVGDAVEKGDILFTLDDSTISPEILQAQSSLLDAQIEFEKMTASDSDYLSALEETTIQESILLNKYAMRHEFYGTNVSDDRVNAVYSNYNTARAEVWELEAAFEKVSKLDEKNPQRVAAYDALQAGILKRDSQLRALSQILGTPYGQRTEGYFIAYDQQVAAVAEARALYQRLLDNNDEIAAAQANMQALQNIVDQANIIAPFSGNITAINSVAGGLVNVGDTAVQLDDLSNLIIDVEISQMDINRINAGEPAQLTFDAIPNAIYSGTVTEISDAGSANGEDAVFNVRIALTNPDEKIKPGFTVTASIIIDQVEDALLVPNTALQYGEGGEVFVITEGDLGELTSVPIEIGARSDAFTELVSGDLNEGDRLAVANADETTAQLRMGLGRLLGNR